MDQTDYTPENFAIAPLPLKEKLKREARNILYPSLTWGRNLQLKSQYDFSTHYDKLYFGQRGNDYIAHRKRLNTFSKIRNKIILIIGCGTGNDLDSWMPYKPKKIIAVDLFNYSKAWKKQTQYFYETYGVEVEFVQGDVSDLNWICENSIDIIGSDAVFEHLRNFKECLLEMKRVLKADGVIYATYGPLWSCWGGDHLSGSDAFSNGYNHILLPRDDYQKYLDTFGDYKHDSNDGRTWIYNQLFSYYKPQDYINILKELGYDFLWKSVIFEPRAIAFLTNYSDKATQLKNLGLSQEDLLITGMTIIIKKH